MQKPSVLIVGAGISGLACAQALRETGVGVRVVDRGQEPGGRMTSRAVLGRTVDLGAAYLTAELGTAFASVVSGWVERGLARPWTDTIAVARAHGIHDHRTGPMRYAAPHGLGSLVAELTRGLDVAQGVDVPAVSPGPDGEVVVLAMPDPQARRLLDASSPLRDRLDAGAGWIPSIAVVLEWEARTWEPFHAAFVNDVPEVMSLADDGDRRGDDAPVLVAHTTADVARQYLDNPEGAIAPVSAAVGRLLGLRDAPVRSFAHRWTYARPATEHPEPFLWADGVGVCGDAWGGRSSVATAWTSGDALGRAIAAGL